VALGGGVLAEFVVAGRPVSLQVRRRDLVRAWRDKVRDASLRDVPGPLPLTTGPVAVEITYYFDVVELDIDNIAKPILDAMKAGLLADDKQVGELLVRKSGPASTAARSARLPATVIATLATSRELVHVVVRALPSGNEP
jgi:crossover junction endodeoxyribonuclease RusA